MVTSQSLTKSATLSTATTRWSWSTIHTPSASSGQEDAARLSSTAFQDRVDIVTGTLGKALGGASGGDVAARREIVEVLRQRARPYLFSSIVAPPIAAATLKALDLISGSTTLRDRLLANTADFRSRMTELCFDVLPGDHPIVPVMIGDEITARDFSQALIAQGVYAVNFSLPVVPRGAARIRTQMSAAHTPEDIDFAVIQFTAVRGALDN